MNATGGGDNISTNNFIGMNGYSGPLGDVLDVQRRTRSSKPCTPLNGSPAQSDVSGDVRRMTTRRRSKPPSVARMIETATGLRYADPDRTRKKPKPVDSSSCSNSMRCDDLIPMGNSIVSNDHHTHNPAHGIVPQANMDAVAVIAPHHSMRTACAISNSYAAPARGTAPVGANSTAASSTVGQSCEDSCERSSSGSSSCSMKCLYREPIESAPGSDHSALVAHVICNTRDVNDETHKGEVEDEPVHTFADATRDRNPNTTSTTSTTSTTTADVFKTTSYSCAPDTKSGIGCHIAVDVQRHAHYSSSRNEQQVVAENSGCDREASSPSCSTLPKADIVVGSPPS
eukprot:Lankesteria_metandrocarpae@DN9302_c0_g1_i1.p1